jgi:signal transduction histidine kinase
MNSKLLNLSRRYQSALRTHLRQGHRASLEPARGLGSLTLAAGLQTLDLAKLHEQTLVAELSPASRAGQRAALIKQAGIFFATAITPLEKMDRTSRESTEDLKKFIEALSQRTVELAASNMELRQEIALRKAVEAQLKKSEQHYSGLLAKSDRLQQQLRQLSRQVLSAQEDERRKISRELHDVIAQTLTGINIRLATLKKEATLNKSGLDRSIAGTQRLVEKSVSIVHRFALELRPAVLDDLGLIPALHSFLKGFSARNGVRTHLTAFAGVEQMDTPRRTALFRVAQEALTNVARHARATRVDVSIEKRGDDVCMKIKDDGKAFAVQRVLHDSGSKHLGLLGMRERLEMVGGSFGVESAAGQGTTITAQIPLRPRPRAGQRARFIKPAYTNFETL